jgi:hypothetical protein
LRVEAWAYPDVMELSPGFRFSYAHSTRARRMFRSMIKEIVDLLDEADEARLLATGTTDAASVQDLLKYAAALEGEATRLDSDWAKESSTAYADKPHRSPTVVRPA